MKKVNGITCCLATGILCSFLSSGAHAADDKLSMEVTPYLWAAGVRTDTTILNQTASNDVSFSDLFKLLHGAFSFLAAGEYKRWVGFTQLDWFNLQDNKATSYLGDAEIRTDFLATTFAGGYRLNGFTKDSTIDLMVGIRYTHLGTKLTIGPFPQVSRNDDLVDGVAVLRPTIPFAFENRLSFSPTASVGAGDSDVTYELSPQFKFDITKNLLARIGYRQLFYREHNANGRIELLMRGWIVGLGYQF